jgi:predicted transcriptional regulator
MLLILAASQGAISTRRAFAASAREQELQPANAAVLLNRLAGKQFVKCEKIGRLNYYTPLVDVEEYRVCEAGGMIERLYENSPAKLFAALFKNNALDENEIAELKRLLEESGE